MKRKLKYILFINIILSCSKGSVKKTDVADNVRQYTMAAKKLDQEKEKILLLSEMNRISYDTLYSILLDYNTMTNQYLKTDSSKYHCENAINFVCQKYNFKKRKIIKLIFNFKYELLTYDDLIENAILEEEYSQSLQQDEYDPL